MLRTGKSACLAAGFAGLLTAFTAFTAFTALTALTALPGAAKPAAASTAATATTTATAATTTTTGTTGTAPTSAGPVGFASLAVKPITFTATYSCDLSAYGTGIAPVSISATLSFAASVQAGTPLDITLTTTSATLPSSVLSKLTGVTSFDLTSAVTAQKAENSSATLLGVTPAPATLAGLPASKAVGGVTFLLTGKGVINVPAAQLTFTPMAAATALSDITCTTTAAKKGISVTVTPEVFPGTGPLYECVYTTPLASTEIIIHVPMTVTSSGSRTTGTTDTVTLASGIGSTSGLSTLKFSSDLPVLGAQPGKIALSREITNPSLSVLRVSGKLRLTKTGTDRILIPEKFTLIFGVPDSGDTIPVTVACTIKASPVPVGLTIKVKKGRSQPRPTPTPTGTGGGGVPEGNGTPSGAPETGGGTGPGADLAAAVGGMAIVVSGGGLVLLGRRRHHDSRHDSHHDSAQ